MSHSHSAIDTDKLVPDSTDMMVEFLGNSDKLVDSDKRWRYADHRDSPDSSAVQGSNRNHRGGGTDYDPYDELDEGVDNYISEKTGGHNVFSHADTARTETERYTDTDVDPNDFGPTLFDANKQKPMSKDELMLAKLNMLRKLGELKQCGVKLSQNYGLDSDLKMMEYEYKLHSDIRAKQNSVQWMGHMLIGIIKGSELLNDNFNPFDIKLEGLSTKISSDMNAYYSVLGEIYEKYNQPGKQMAPEFKLLMMITGAALSMQVNRALPGFMGGIANSVQNDESLKNDLRRKAASESGNQGTHGNNSQGGNTEGMGNNGTNQANYAESQHALAAQQVADIKFMREKEEEYQRSLRQAEMARQRGGFVLSSDHPESDSEPQREEPQFTRDQIEAMRREKEMREMKYLEALRQKAKINSHAYRSGSSQAGIDFDRARAHDLERQSRNLDDLLGSLEDETDVPNRFNSHPERVVQPKPKSQSKAQSRARTKATKSRRSERDDNRSTMSSASSVSYNPKLGQIMRETSRKTTTTRKSGSNRGSQKSYEDISPDSISFGSTDKKSKKQVTVKFDNLTDSSSQLRISSKHESKPKTKGKSKSKSPSNKSNANVMDEMDFGTISFGSAKKGVSATFKTG